jgi:5-formyltetrahydrofolate cyclo-ligase
MAAPHTDGLIEVAKRAARAAAKAARAACDAAAGEKLTEHVLRDAAPPAAARVGGFWPLPGEIDIKPLLYALAERGHVVALPSTPARGQPLTFRVWEPGTVLTAGRFGTCEARGPVLRPDLLLVPLLAFDRRGYRLGYGAGYYDRTIAFLPGVRTLGCAFAAQELDELPVGPYDAKLDAVATERGVIRFMDT